MSTLQNMERRGTAAVRRLRRQKLAKGLPFMINLNELPSNQCYLEYPDGSIQLVALTANKQDFAPVRQLSQQEVQELRIRFRLAD